VYTWIVATEMILAKAQAEVDLNEDKDATIRSYADSLAAGTLFHDAMIDFFALLFPPGEEKQYKLQSFLIPRGGEPAARWAP
jgi:hypothetical protein